MPIVQSYEGIFSTKINSSHMIVVCQVDINVGKYCVKLYKFLSIPHALK